MKNKKSYLAFIIPFLVIVLDQISKSIIRGSIELNNSIPIIKNIFHLTYIQNTGSLFGLFRGVKYINIFFIIISFIVIFVLIYYIQKNSPSVNFFADYFFVSLGLLLGGAIGNLIDRIIFGHVIDFMDFRIWPVFNLADSAISIGIILLIVYFWREK